MILPLIWSLVRADGEFLSLFFTLAIYVAVGLALILPTRHHRNIRAKEGFLIVTLSWIVVSLIGALPFSFSGVFSDYVSSFFESMSG
ncbi:MAG: TrkH family potassium uptake protein, partial [Clostridia bacterium]